MSFDRCIIPFSKTSVKAHVMLLVDVDEEGLQGSTGRMASQSGYRLLFFMICTKSCGVSGLYTKVLPFQDKREKGQRIGNGHEQPCLFLFKQLLLHCGVQQNLSPQ